jgi:hypothetical protein
VRPHDHNDGDLDLRERAGGCPGNLLRVGEEPDPERATAGTGSSLRLFFDEINQQSKKRIEADFSMGGGVID